MRTKQLQMRHDHCLKVKNIHLRQKKKAFIKNLTQKIKRKDNQLQKAKTSMDLAEARKIITKQDKKHEKLKSYHKEKRKPLILPLIIQMRSLH